MFNIFKFKKGVSPLIATILLIAFAVALGSVVMNWGFNFEIGKTTDICAGVEIKLRNIGNAQACYGSVEHNGYINFILDNTGSVDISGLGILIVGEKGTRLFDLDAISLAKGTLYDKKDKQVSIDFNAYGSVNEIQFIPKVGTEVCTNNAVKAKNIGICS